MEKGVLLLSLLFVIPLAHAWDWDTHPVIAEQALLAHFPGCDAQIRNGSIYPDQVLKDTVNHHCYTACPVNDSAYCPTKLDCPAYGKAAQWVEKSRSQSSCEAAFSLAVASHYYADVHVPMHNLRNEDYEGCHKNFEDKVGEVAKGKKSFPVTQCCEHPKACFSFTQADFDATVADVASRLGYPLQGTTPATPSGDPLSDASSNQMTGYSIYDGSFVNTANVMLLCVIVAFVAATLGVGLFKRRRRR